MRYDTLVGPGASGAARSISDAAGSFYGGAGIAAKIAVAHDEDAQGKRRRPSPGYAVPVTDFDGKTATIKLKNQWPLPVYVAATGFDGQGGSGSLKILQPGDLVQ